MKSDVANEADRESGGGCTIRTICYHLAVDYQEPRHRRRSLAILHLLEPSVQCNYHDNVLLTPVSVEVWIWPVITSPLKGRKTISLNSTTQHISRISDKQRLSPTSLTVDVGDSGAVADEAIGCFQDVIQTDTEAYFLDHLKPSFSAETFQILMDHQLIYFVGIFRIDVVLDGLCARLLEILWSNLDQIRDRGLFLSSDTFQH